jgi:hypothetical protein
VTLHLASSAADKTVGIPFRSYSHLTIIFIFHSPCNSVNKCQHFKGNLLPPSSWKKSKLCKKFGMDVEDRELKPGL